MSLTPAVKAALRKMTPIELAAVLQDTDQPRSNKQERAAHGKIQKKDLVIVAAVAKAIRPLNSWIAYRSKQQRSSVRKPTSNKMTGYYSTIFLTFQQKEISGFLTILWQNDPFKAKWSILAKSYSLIRDSQGKANAPLEKFLAINGPLIGVIEPAQYLEALSWEIAVDEDGQTVMRRYGNSIDEQLFITNVSVNDVIRNSYDQGYFTGDLSKVLLAKNEAAMTMAVSEQPTSKAQHSTTGHLEGHEANFMASATIEGSSKDGKQAPTTMVIDEDESDSAIATNANEAGAEESMAEDNDDASGDSSAVLNENALPAGTTPAVMTATETNSVDEPQNVGHNSHSDNHANTTGSKEGYMVTSNDPDVSSLSASAFNLDGEYPFNTEFDPDLSGSTFDPFMGNRFNVFDVSDASWQDLIDFNASA